MVELKKDERGVIVAVRAQAGARRTGVVREREGMLHVAVTAAAEKGKANRAIIGVLSEMLSVPKSRIELISGETSPKKRFLIVGAEMEPIQQKLAELFQ